jgi:hypothetical protein
MLDPAQGRRRSEMSDEKRKDEIEVEGHVTRHGANDETTDEDESEVEAHIRSLPNVRMDSPRDT